VDSSAAPSRPSLAGIHHVTLICSSLERTAAFYRDVLGMTLVKEMRNADDANARHFVFGDAGATPGTVVTFMEYPAMPEGSVGRGSTHHLALRVRSLAELESWRVHLIGHGVPCSEVMDRGYYHSLYLRDPDGHILELATDGPGYDGAGEDEAPSP
jgi:glyoxalase family protein